MISATQARAEASIRKQLWLGTTVVFVLLFGIGGWAALANISGAVIASGTVVVDSNNKKIQHPTGGIIGELLVKEGDQVALTPPAASSEDIDLGGSVIAPGTSPGPAPVKPSGTSRREVQTQQDAGGPLPAATAAKKNSTDPSRL